MHLLEDVFKKSGVPEITFVEPSEYSRLKVSLRSKGRGTIIEGPSGIGKTTSILRVVSELNLKDSTLILSGRREADVDVIKNLPTMGDLGLIIIDDFHRLEDKIKHSIADFIKMLADEDSKVSKVVIIGINNAGQALINYASDLTGRIDRISFESNSEEKIRELVEKGEEALNVKINIADEIVSEANGSFHIAQMLCHETCLEAGITETQPDVEDTETSFELIRENVLKELSGTFLDVSKLFATGPRLRKEGRAPYFHLLLWLSQSPDWSLNIEDALRQHPEHRASITQVVDKGYLKDFIAKNDAIHSVLHFDQETKILGVEDPKFFFFISNILWNKFANKIGFVNIAEYNPYDLALSFAGANRRLAEAIFKEFESRDVTVFYDKNEQHRILASDVEKYLEPIYKSQATFVVCILGVDYPQRIWTKFESEQFKDRFSENSVIPIRMTDMNVGVFDQIAKVGRIDFDVNGDFDKQVMAACDTISLKLTDFKATHG